MGEPLKIRRDLLPLGEWPEHLVEEVSIAQLMFDDLAERQPAGSDTVVSAYIVAFRGDSRALFFVQDAMNAKDDGKDAVERLAVSCVLTGANEIVLVCESWMVRSDKDDVASVHRYREEHGSLRDHPDATERLSLTYHAPDGDIVTAAEIRHRDGERPRLLDWAAQRQTVERGQGRFQNFFLKAASFRGEDN